MWGIIGGTGFENFENFVKVEDLDESTPFGNCSSGLKKVKINDTEAYFISRHGKNHELLPSEVNYRANIYNLKKLGATKIISISAVGSLKKEYKPGDLVIPNQYIDRTKSLRKHTFCGEGIIGHVSLAHPTSKELTNTILKIKSELNFDIHFRGTYVCIEGPCFSSQAESKTYIQAGADIIGMTNFPEYALAREAGIAYLPCSFVTDYDCWDDSIPHVTLQEVIKIMKENNKKAFQILEKIIPVNQNILTKGCSELGLKNGLMITLDKVPSEKKEWLSVIIQ